MCGLPIPFWTTVIMVVIMGLVVWKLRGWFKKGLPLLEHLRDGGHGFLLYLVFCFGMLFAAISVAQLIGENNDKITAFFAAVREKCEPKEEPIADVDAYIERELDKIRQRP